MAKVLVLPTRTLLAMLLMAAAIGAAAVDLLADGDSHHHDHGGR